MADVFFFFLARKSFSSLKIKRSREMQDWRAQQTVISMEMRKTFPQSFIALLRKQIIQQQPWALHFILNGCNLFLFCRINKGLLSSLMPIASSWISYKDTSNQHLWIATFRGEQNKRRNIVYSPGSQYQLWIWSYQKEKHHL